MLLGHEKSNRAIVDRAEVSRPGKTAWKIRRPGVRGGTRQLRHSNMNWYHPFLWSMIDSIAPRVGWLAQGIVTHLQRQSPALFGSLHRGTVHKWFSKKRSGWSEATKKNVARRAALARSGRTGILAQHPLIVEEVKKRLHGLRDSKVAVTVLVVRALMIAIVKEKNPELLVDFTCSEVSNAQITMRNHGSYLVSVLHTEFSGKRHELDHPQRHSCCSPCSGQCHQSLRSCAFPHRSSNVLVRYSASSELHIASATSQLQVAHLTRRQLLINMDQTGVILIPGDNYTYEEKASTQVEIVGKDEKRAFTLVVATSCGGDVLPFQQVWGGATKKSCPSDNADGMDEALKLGFDFTPARSAKKGSHFSTLKTMKEVSCTEGSDGFAWH